MSDSAKGSEKKDFWDISALVPQAKKQKGKPPLSRDVSTTLVTAPPQHRAENTKTYFVSRTYESELRARAVPERAYTPVHSLLLAVRIYAREDAPNWHDRFREQVIKLYPYEGKSCPHVSFFSYVPQYGQMSRAQLDYYLWWRTNFRQGRVIEADFSYLLLYLYEIINLGEAIDPARGQAELLRLWVSYRRVHQGLDALAREWLSDYSLLHALPPPALPPEDLRDMIKGARLRELYVGGADESARRDAMLHFCSNYDYRKSKFYEGDARALYDRVLPGAISVAFDYLQQENAKNASRQGGYSTVTLELFTGAPVAERYKKQVEVDFLSFSHTYSMRYVVSDVLKYAENAIRAYLGVKSRLSVYEVPSALMPLLDAYLRDVLPAKSQKRAAQDNVPAYEARYDLPVAPLSVARAREIEAASWETTKKLVEAFGEEPFVAQPLVPEPEKAIPSPTVLCEKGENTAAASPWHAALGDLVEFLALAVGGTREAQRAFAAANGMMLELLVDKINTVSVDILGDVLLEEADGRFVIIEDYLPELQAEGVLSCLML